MPTEVQRVFDYLICSTPRSGSNLLCSMVTHARVLGHPTEYLNPYKALEQHALKVGFATAQEATRDISLYIQRLRDKNGAPDGTIGLKIHYHQLQWLEGQRFPFDRFFGRPALYITRGDLLGQAISLVRGNQTDAWSGREEERRPPEFDGPAILQAVDSLAAQQVHWEHWFVRTGRKPWRLCYERLVERPVEELGAALRFLGRPVEPARLEAAVAAAQGTFRLQRDALNEEWRERYLDWMHSRPR